MNPLPKGLRVLVDHFDKLPGIGPKHATRLALFLLNRKNLAEDLSNDIASALENLRFCDQCSNISDDAKCSICADPHRDQSTICVLAHVQDIESIERIGTFNGTYHILHGSINPIEGITPDDIRIKELLKRAEASNVTEIILALDATSDGEATALYLENQLKETDVKTTRLARGIPAGSSIEYTDEATLTSAFQNRK